MKRLVTLFLFLSFFAAFLTAQEPLAPSVYQLIGEATFEVVVEKPTADSLMYEREIPYELLPYSVRTDNYFSVGTAFAVAGDRFVTAAHVLGLEVETQNRKLFLRDTSGTVYELENIYKFDRSRDYVEFSAQGLRVDHYFSFSREPELNTSVLAVGNAFGEGVIARNGVLTSTTPEQSDGRWNWLRFSAPASPGNSGGPLIDEQGRVLGIVTMKTENENLNYALPVSEYLQAKEGSGNCFLDLRYGLSNTSRTASGTFDHTLILPAGYHAVQNELVAFEHTASRTLLDQLIAENRDELFPNGPGSQNLLYDSFVSVFPRLIGEADDGTWDAYRPRELTTAQLPEGGFIRHGDLGGMSFFYLQSPEDMALSRLVDEPKTGMDLILEGWPLYRTISDESIRITSLGMPVTDARHTDRWGRTWLVRKWKLEFADALLVSYSLPVPGGMAGFIKHGSTDEINNGWLFDMGLFSDYLYFSYSGTFKEWSEFLALGKLLPRHVSTLSLSRAPDRVTFSSPALALEYDQALLKSGPESVLTVGIGYTTDPQQPHLAITTVTFGESVDSGNAFTVEKVVRPGERVREAARSTWRRAVAGSSPFDRVRVFDDGLTTVGQVYSRSKPEGTDPPFVYTLSVRMDGQRSEEELLSKLDTLDNALVITK